MKLLESVSTVQRRYVNGDEKVAEVQIVSHDTDGRSAHNVYLMAPSNPFAQPGYCEPKWTTG